MRIFEARLNCCKRQSLISNKQSKRTWSELRLESSSDFPAAIQQLLAKMQQHLGEIHPAFMRDIQREAPEIFESVEIRRRDLIHRYFSKILAQGRRAGIIRKDIPIRTDN